MSSIISFMFCILLHIHNSLHPLLHHYHSLHNQHIFSRDYDKHDFWSLLVARSTCKRAFSYAPFPIGTACFCAFFYHVYHGFVGWGGVGWGGMITFMLRVMHNALRCWCNVRARWHRYAVLRWWVGWGGVGWGGMITFMFTRDAQRIAMLM